MFYRPGLNNILATSVTDFRGAGNDRNYINIPRLDTRDPSIRNEHGESYEEGKR